MIGEDGVILPFKFNIIVSNVINKLGRNEGIVREVRHLQEDA